MSALSDIDPLIRISGMGSAFVTGAGTPSELTLALSRAPSTALRAAESLCARCNFCQKDLRSPLDSVDLAPRCTVPDSPLPGETLAPLALVVDRLSFVVVFGPPEGIGDAMSIAPDLSVLSLSVVPS